MSSLITILALFFGCNLGLDVDRDNDGVPNTEDCSDADPSMHIGAVEICDGKDNNCNGKADDLSQDGPLGMAMYKDADGDGYGVGIKKMMCPGAAKDLSPNRKDCDDSDREIRPGAIDRCDGIDNNCDGADGEDNDGDRVFTCRIGQLPVDPDDTSPVISGWEGRNGDSNDNCLDHLDNDGDGKVDASDGDCRDRDVDGFSEGFDACPEIAGMRTTEHWKEGRWSPERNDFSGCPEDMQWTLSAHKDADNDSVADRIDQCSTPDPHSLSGEERIVMWPLRPARDVPITLASAKRLRWGCTPSKKTQDLRRMELREEARRY